MRQAFCCESCGFALYAARILELSFDTTLQSVFMTIFFCSVGFTACFRLLKKGGLQVFLFLGLAVAICVIQDAVGSGLAAAFGLDPTLQKKTVMKTLCNVVSKESSRIPAAYNAR